MTDYNSTEWEWKSFFLEHWMHIYAFQGTNASESFVAQYTWEVQQGRKGSSVTKKNQGRNTVTRKKKLSSDKEEKAQQWQGRKISAVRDKET